MRRENVTAEETVIWKPEAGDGAEIGKKAGEICVGLKLLVASSWQIAWIRFCPMKPFQKGATRNSLIMKHIYRVEGATAPPQFLLTAMIDTELRKMRACVNAL